MTSVSEERRASLGHAPSPSAPVDLQTVRFDKRDFLMPPHYEEYVESILIPHGLIMDRIEKLAFNIYNAYRGKELHLLCVLKGAQRFFCELLKVLTRVHTYSSTSSKLPPYMEHYVRVKSYQNDQSTGSINVISEDLSVLRGKHVLIVEDIIDTGLTLSKFCAWLQKQHEPESIATASLLVKNTSRSNGFQGDYVGFIVPDVFVIGYSFDFNEYFRDMEHIGELNEKGKLAFRQETTAKAPAKAPNGITVNGHEEVTLNGSSGPVSAHVGAVATNGTNGVHHIL